MPDSPSRNPFEGVTDYFSELNRMRAVGIRGPLEPGTEHVERTHGSAWVPPTDIFARGDDLVIRVELAGIDPQDVDLRYTNGLLTVSGTRASGFDEGEEVEFYVRERFYGAFRRVITLPEGTDASQISAQVEDVLVEINVRNGVGSPRSTRIQLADRSSGPTSRSVRDAR